MKKLSTFRGRAETFQILICLFFSFKIIGEKKKNVPQRQTDFHVFRVIHHFYYMENRKSLQFGVIPCLGSDMYDERLESNMTMLVQNRNGIK